MKAVLRVIDEEGTYAIENISERGTYVLKVLMKSRRKSSKDIFEINGEK